MGPLEWNPPPPTPSDHYCFYVRAASPQDPITFAETGNVDTNSRNSNNVVWRNFNVVDLVANTAPGEDATFLVRNIDDEQADVDLVLEVPKEFLEIGEVLLRLSPQLEKRWMGKEREIEGLLPLREYLVAGRPDAFGRRPRAGVGGIDGGPFGGIEEEPRDMPRLPYRLAAPSVYLRGFRLAPRQAEPVTLTFRSKCQREASCDIDVVQQVGERIVGGIRYTVRTHPGKAEFRE